MSYIPRCATCVRQFRCQRGLSMHLRSFPGHRAHTGDPHDNPSAVLAQPNNAVSHVVGIKNNNSSVTQIPGGGSNGFDEEDPVSRATDDAEPVLGKEKCSELYDQDTVAYSGVPGEEDANIGSNNNDGFDDYPAECGGTLGSRTSDDDVFQDVSDGDDVGHQLSIEEEIETQTAEGPADSDSTPDFSLLNQYTAYVNSGFGTMLWDGASKSDVKLLAILKMARAPIYLFDKIKEWVRESSVDNVEWLGNCKKRKRVLEDIQKRFGLDCAKPKLMELLLPGCQTVVSLVTHDFKEQLYSLLTDPAVMRDENLLFHNDNPLSPPPTPADAKKHAFVLRDVNDGSAYRNAYNLHCTVAGRDILVCVIFFIDKTHVDVQGRLCLEPVTFTLSIFKKEARSKPMFWRTIGYVINQSNLKTLKPLEKAKDYHLVLEHVLQSVIDVQQGPGIAWRFIYKSQVFNVVMKKFPVMFVSGDTEGHDKMCGKFLSRSLQVARLCRYCECPTAETDNPDGEWALTEARDIIQLSGNHDVDKLRGMSYHCLENAFRKVLFCDPVRGINGATPAELLHVWQKGMFLRFLCSLFGQKRARKRASKKQRLPQNRKEAGKPKKARGGTVLKNAPHNQFDDADVDDNVADDFDDDDDEGLDDIEEEISDDDDLVEDDFTEEAAVKRNVPPGYPAMDKNTALQVYGVFSDSVKVEFDAMAKKYGRVLCHQSDREFNRAYFPSGITGNAKKNGHEERCVLLLCLLILVSDKGHFFDEMLDGSVKTTDDGALRSGAFIEMTTQLLLMENFLKVDCVSVHDLRLYKKFVPIFLQNYKQVVGREQGAGMKFVKFHLPLHSFDDISRFGPPQSWDSSIGEANHVPHKESSRHTQRNTEDFEHQTATRHSENMIIDRATRNLYPPKSLIGADCIQAGDEDTGTAASQPSQRHYVTRGANYFVCESGMFVNKCASLSTLPTPAIWADARLQERVEAFIIQNILPLSPTRRVELATELKWTEDGTIFRANPSYGKANLAWHDWADINWCEPGETQNPNDIIPARLVIYLVLDDFSSDTAIEFDYFGISGPGTYVIVQSLIESIYSENPDVKRKTNNLYTGAEIKNYLSHPVCSVVYWSMLEPDEYTYKNTSVCHPDVPKLRVVPVDTMVSPRIVVPYDIANTDFENVSVSSSWLIIEPVKKWGSLFVEEMEMMIKG